MTFDIPVSAMWSSWEYVKLEEKDKEKPFSIMEQR